MSKTLTEQWRERTLKSGTYYIKVNLGDNLIYTFDYYNDRNNKWDFFRDIREVLDIVPSYDEYKRLQEALMWYKSLICKLDYNYGDIVEDAEEELKMEGVK